MTRGRQLARVEVGFIAVDDTHVRVWRLLDDCSALDGAVECQDREVNVHVQVARLARAWFGEEVALCIDGDDRVTVLVPAPREVQRLREALLTLQEEIEGRLQEATGARRAALEDLGHIVEGALRPERGAA